MNDVCRFCLSVCPQITYALSEDCEILDKIQTYLSVPISINQSLPSQVCQLCVDKIEDLHNYIIKVIHNQHILIENYDKGILELNKFYASLKNDVKPEITETSLAEDKENDNLNINNDKYRNDTKLIKQETIDCDDLNNYSSEDEKTLSSIKIAKETTTKLRKKRTKKLLETENTLTKQNSDVKNEITELKYKIVERKHKCLTCFELLHTQNELLKHYHKEHGKMKITEDVIPADKYTTVTSDDGIVTFKCNKCNRECNNKRDINRHVIAHIENRPFVCKMCGRTYKTVSEIIRHGRAHNGLKLECSYQCGYSTVYMGALKEHERRHGSEFKYKCEKCNKGFQVKTWYVEHQNIHEGIKPFVCDICGLAFHMNRYLTAHRSTVHPQTSSLKRYVCVHCSLPCDTRNALTEHLKVHGIKTSFLCDICGKTLANSEQLKFHKRMHLGVKPYICSTCNKAFTKKFTLKQHEGTHSGARAHTCDACGKHYTQRSTLLRHNMRHHAGSLKCSKCQKIFINRSQLESHQKLCISS